MQKEDIYIAIDFDGTCVTHEYPYIGQSTGAEETLKDLIKAGHKLILNTMRSGKQLREAEAWFQENGILLYGVNLNPTQRAWTQSPKVYAHLYIDDAGFNCPLVKPDGARPYADWVKIREGLKDLGLIMALSQVKVKKSRKTT